jgi:hypothetical protein
LCLSRSCTPHLFICFHLDLLSVHSCFIPMTLSHIFLFSNCLYLLACPSQLRLSNYNYNTVLSVIYCIHIVFIFNLYVWCFDMHPQVYLICCMVRNFFSTGLEEWDQLTNPAMPPCHGSLLLRMSQCSSMNSQQNEEKITSVYHTLQIFRLAAIHRFNTHCTQAMSVSCPWMHLQQQFLKISVSSWTPIHLNNAPWVLSSIF